MSEMKSENVCKISKSVCFYDWDKNHQRKGDFLPDLSSFLREPEAKMIPIILSAKFCHIYSNSNLQLLLHFRKLLYNNLLLSFLLICDGVVLHDLR